MCLLCLSVFNYLPFSTVICALLSHAPFVSHSLGDVLGSCRSRRCANNLTIAGPKCQEICQHGKQNSMSVVYGAGLVCRDLIPNE